MMGECLVLSNGLGSIGANFYILLARNLFYF